MNPSRIIIGEHDSKSGEILFELYKGIKAPVLHTDLRTAEMIKMASNVFLATKISFINEIGNICKLLNIDIKEVVRGMAYDERIGGKFLNAGLGYGGSCLPKDIGSLTALSKRFGYYPRLLQEVINLNEHQALKPVELLQRHLFLRGATIGVLGLAFKPGTNDIRESRAIGIVNALLREGAFVKAYDPMAVDDFKKVFPDINYVTAEEVLNSDAVIIVTEWEEFHKLDYRGKTVIDGRGLPKAREAKIYEGLCW
ncbi:nucleotide sugar dehydrogenase [Chloroflexota bacterium]